MPDTATPMTIPTSAGVLRPLSTIPSIARRARHNPADGPDAYSTAEERMPDTATPMTIPTSAGTTHFMPRSAKGIASKGNHAPAKNASRRAVATLTTPVKPTTHGQRRKDPIHAKVGEGHRIEGQPRAREERIAQSSGNAHHAREAHNPRPHARNEVAPFVHHPHEHDHDRNRIQRVQQRDRERQNRIEAHIGNGTGEHYSAFNNGTENARIASRPTLETAQENTAKPRAHMR